MGHRITFPPRGIRLSGLELRIKVAFKKLSLSSSTTRSPPRMRQLPVLFLRGTLLQPIMRRFSPPFRTSELATSRPRSFDRKLGQKLINPSSRRANFSIKPVLRGPLLRKKEKSAIRKNCSTRVKDSNLEGNTKGFVKFIKIGERGSR